MTPPAMAAEPANSGPLALLPAGKRPVGGARAARVRRARAGDVAGIVALVAEWAGEGLLLPRGAGEIAAALDDYVVAVDPGGCVLACAAVREYAPSLAEVVSVAVARAAHGGGLGARVVAAAEALAHVRGHTEVFAHTRNPEFFTAIGYECVDRARYPEKRGRAWSVCVRRSLADRPLADRPLADCGVPAARVARADGHSGVRQAA